MINKKTYLFIGVLLLVTGAFHYGGAHPEQVEKAFESVFTVPPHKVPKLRKHWKNAGGEVPADFLSFKNPDYDWIRNDTIFLKDRPVAVITRVSLRIVFDYEMEVRLIPNGEKGRYVSKASW